MPVVITVDGSPGPSLLKYPASPADTVTLGVVVPTDIVSYAWTLEAPAGSLAALSDPTAAAPTFDLDKVGSYLVRLSTVLTTGGTATASTVVGVNLPWLNMGGRIPAFGETLEAGTRGWAESVDAHLQHISQLALSGTLVPCFNRSASDIQVGSVVKVVGYESVPISTVGGPTMIQVADIELANDTDGTDNVFGIVPVFDTPGAVIAHDERWYVVLHGPVEGVRCTAPLTAGQEVSRTAADGVVDVGGGAVVGYGIGGDVLYVGSPAGRGGGGGSSTIIGGGVVQDSAAGSLNVIVPPGEYDNGVEKVPIGQRYASVGILGTQVTITRPVTTGVIPGQILPGAAACSYLAIRKADGALVQREGTVEDYGETLVANKTGGGVGGGQAAPDGRAFLCRFLQAVPGASVVEGIALKLTSGNMNTVQVAACEDNAGVPNLATLVVLGNPLAGSDPMNPDYIILRGLSYPVVGGAFWLLFIFGGMIPEPARTVNGILLPGVDYLEAGWTWDSLIYTDDGGMTTFPFAGGLEMYDIEVMFEDTPSAPNYPAADPLYADVIAVGTSSNPVCVNDGGRDTAKLLVMPPSEEAVYAFGVDEAPAIWLGV